MAQAEIYKCNKKFNIVHNEGTSYESIETRTCTKKADDAKILYIDIDTIESLCDEIATKANDILAIEKIITLAADQIDKKALSVNGQGIEKLKTDCSGIAVSNHGNLVSTVNGAKEQAIAYYFEKQNFLNQLFIGSHTCG